MTCDNDLSGHRPCETGRRLGRRLTQSDIKKQYPSSAAASHAGLTSNLSAKVKDQPMKGPSTVMARHILRSATFASDMELNVKEIGPQYMRKLGDGVGLCGYEMQCRQLRSESCNGPDGGTNCFEALSNSRTRLKSLELMSATCLNSITALRYLLTLSPARRTLFVQIISARVAQFRRVASKPKRHREPQEVEGPATLTTHFANPQYE